MDDLAAQKPKAIQAWTHYRRTVAPKEQKYHRAAWLLNQAAEHHALTTNSQKATQKKG